MQAKPVFQENRLRQTELVKLAAKAGTQYQIKSTFSAPTEVMQGGFQISRNPSGLLLHTTDGLELQDITVSIQLPPSLVFSVVLEGRLEFSVEGYSQVISTSPQLDSYGECFAMNLLQPAQLLRELRKGNKLRKVNVSIQHSWLESLLDEGIVQDRQIIRLIDRHLELPRWQATPQLRQLAEQILRPPEYEGVMKTLFLESRALEMVAASLHSISKLYHKNTGDMPNHSRTGISTSAKAAKIRKYIEAHLLPAKSTQLPTNLEQIASDVGMSISNMQRLFKQTYGQTVFEYIRQRRLEMARDAIEKKRISIGEAAYIAGYKHCSNFATAFKRAFGVSPGAL